MSPDWLEHLTLLYIFFHTILGDQQLTSEGNTTTPQDGRVWDVVIATCDEPGAGTDAAVYLKVYYESAHDYETFNLDNPGRDDFERGAKDHFKLFFKQGDIINMGLFWWPGFTFSQSWCAKWVLLLNSDTETCFEGIFNKWILHYKDPPTYATRFHKLRFADCVAPGSLNASRRSYMRYDDMIGTN
nr:Hypothetical protein CBG23386 [Haemonchus contortus]